MNLPGKRKYIPVKKLTSYFSEGGKLGDFKDKKGGDRGGYLVKHSG